MAAETVPLSVSTPATLRIAFVPGGSDPLSVAILGGATTKDLTYSLTPSGFNRTTTQAVISDPRLTLNQDLSRPGIVTETLEVQYVYGDTNDVAKEALAEGTTGFVVARYAVPNATAWTVAQEVDSIPVVAGVQRKDAPTANGVWTITQTLYVTGVVQRGAALIA